jgi:hypothetical protein
MDFEKLTVVQLKELAKNKGLKGYSKFKKADLISLLKFSRKSTRKSPRKSSRKSPRKSTRKSPRKSSRKSPRKSPQKSPRRKEYESYNVSYLTKLIKEKNIKGYSRLRKSELIDLLLYGQKPKKSPQRRSTKRRSTSRRRQPSPKQRRSTKRRSTSRRRQPSPKQPSPKQPSPSPPKYTKEQYDLVQKILKTSVLSPGLIFNISLASTVPQIKKEFLRLSLLIHPDKNKAPGSTEAFQKLQQMRDRAILDRELFERATGALNL